jgi:hypothetical protein
MTIKLIQDNWKEDVSSSFEIVTLGMFLAFGLGVYVGTMWL